MWASSAWAQVAEVSPTYSPVHVADSPAVIAQIEQADQWVESQRLLDAVMALQPVIETMSSKLIQRDERTYQSAALWVEQHICSNDALLEAYREALSVTADRQWQLARKRVDESAMAQVLDHYGLTDAGREAGLALAGLRLEQADADGARAVLQRLTHLHDLSRLSPRYDFLSAVAAMIDADTLSLAYHREQLQQRSATEALAQLEALSHRIHPPARLEPVELVNFKPPGDGPALWTLPLAEADPVIVQTGNNRLRVSQKSSALLPVLPFVEGEHIWVNLGRSILKVDAISGRQQWTYTPPPEDPSEDIAAPFRRILQRGRVIADRRGVAVLRGQVIGVLGDALVWNQRRQPRVQMTTLVCLDRKTGDLQWNVQPQQLDESLTQGYFVGTPISDGRYVYAAVRRHRTSGLLDSFLLAINPVDGTLHWRRHLSSLATRQRTDQHPPIELLQKKGRLYVYDGTATVSAIDPRTGRIHWLTVLIDKTTTHNRSIFRTPRNHVLISPMVLCQAGLLVPPNNAADSIFLLEPNTGRILRRLDDEPWDKVKVLADAGEHVLGLGEQVTLFDGHSLDLVWQRSINLTQPATALGQPRVTQQSIILSTANEILRLDRSDGTTQQRFPSDAPGHVMALDGQIVLATGRQLSGYLDWAEAAAILRQRMVTHPRDPQPGLSLAHLAMKVKQEDAVLEGADHALHIMRLSPPSAEKSSTQAKIFNEILSWTTTHHSGSNELRGRLLDRLATATRSAIQTIAYRLRAGELDEQLHAPADAVAHYHVLLSDPTLGETMYRHGAMLRRAGDEAQRRIKRLMTQHGPAVYAPFDLRASQQLDLLTRTHSPDAMELIALADRYPLAAASGRALVAAAVVFENAANHHQAVRQLRRAYSRVREPALRGELVGQLATIYEQLGRNRRAEQWLGHVSREHPGLTVVRQGQPVAIDTWLSDLAGRQVVAITRPRLTAPLGQPIKLSGTLIQPIHRGSVTPPYDRWLMRAGPSLTMHTLARPEQPQWTWPLTQADMQVLTFDDEQVLLWSADSGELVALDTVTGEIAWPTVQVKRQLEQAGDISTRRSSRPPEQQRFLEMIDNGPILRRQQAGKRNRERSHITHATDESVVCMIDEVGRMLAVDRLSGQLLWRTMTSLERTGPIAIRGGHLAVAGVHGQGNDALSSALIVLDAQTGEPRFAPIEDREPILWLGISLGGQVIAVSPRHVTAYDIDTGQVAWRYTAEAAAMIGRVWPGDQTLLTQTENGSVELLSLDTGKLIKRIAATRNLLLDFQPLADHWQMIAREGASAWDATGQLLWRDAIGGGLGPSAHQTLAAQTVVLLRDRASKLQIWLLDAHTGRIVDKQVHPHRLPQPINVSQIHSIVLADHLLIGIDDQTLLIRAATTSP